MRYLIIALLGVFTFGNINAQELSKEEKKELLLQIKELKKDPAKLKKLKENVEVRDLTIEQQTEEINILKNDMQIRNVVIAELNDSLANIAYTLETAKEANNMYNQGGSTSMDNSGYQYRIQIGLFQNFNITHLFDDPKFIMHESVDGMHRYSVGNFTSESDAEAFKVELRRLGIKDAFVTTYNNGTRTTDVNTYVEPAPQVQDIYVAPEQGDDYYVEPESTPVQVNTHIESNPFPVQNGTVISTKPAEEGTTSSGVQTGVIQERPKSELQDESGGIKINEGSISEQEDESTGIEIKVK